MGRGWGGGVPFSDSEARLDGAGGPPAYRHAVHLGFGPIVEGGPARLLQAVLLKHEGKKKKKSQTRLPLRFGLSGDVAPACVTERRSAEPGGVESNGWMRMVEAREELEEQEKQKRLGPGGLDPVEVHKSLPGVNVIYSMTRHHVKI